MKMARPSFQSISPRRSLQASWTRSPVSARVRMKARSRRRIRRSAKVSSSLAAGSSAGWAFGGRPRPRWGGTGGSVVGSPEGVISSLMAGTARSELCSGSSSTTAAGSSLELGAWGRAGELLARFIANSTTSSICWRGNWGRRWPGLRARWCTSRRRRGRLGSDSRSAARYW